MSRMIDSIEHPPSGQTTPEVADQELADEEFSRHPDDVGSRFHLTNLAMTTTGPIPRFPADPNEGTETDDPDLNAFNKLVNADPEAPKGSIDLPKPARPTLLGMTPGPAGPSSPSLARSWLGRSGPSEDQCIGSIHRNDSVLDGVLRSFQSGHPSMNVRLVREKNQDGLGAWTAFTGHKSYKVRYMFEDEASGLKVLRPVTMTVSCCTRPLLNPNGLKSETGEEEASSPEIKLYLGWNKEPSAAPPGYDSNSTRILGFPGPPIAEDQVDEVHAWRWKNTPEKDSDPEKVAFHIGLPTVLGVPSHGDKTVVFATEPVAVYDGDLAMKGDDKRMTGLEDASADSVYLQVTITADTSKLTASEIDHARKHQAESDAIWKEFTQTHQSGKEINYRGLIAAGATQGIDHLMGLIPAAESEAEAGDGKISLLGPGYNENFNYMLEHSKKPKDDSEVTFPAPPPRVPKSSRYREKLARKAGGRSVGENFDAAQNARKDLWSEQEKFDDAQTAEEVLQSVQGILDVAQGASDAEVQRSVQDSLDEPQNFLDSFRENLDEAQEPSDTQDLQFVQVSSQEAQNAEALWSRQRRLDKAENAKMARVFDSFVTGIPDEDQEASDTEGLRSVQVVSHEAQTANKASEMPKEVASPSMWREGSEFAPSATVTTTKLHGQQRREPSTINPHWLTSKQARQEEDESAAPDADQTGDQAATTLFGYLVAVEQERVAEEKAEKEELSQRIHDFESTRKADSIIPSATADGGLSDLDKDFGDMTIEEDDFNVFDGPEKSASVERQAFDARSEIMFTE